MLVFSGEDFPEPGTPDKLRSRGHSLEGKGPTYLVHLSEEDPAFPKCLNGRFHGLLVNRSDATTTLFNDRYGMHRIYYHQSPIRFTSPQKLRRFLKLFRSCVRQTHGV